MGRFKTLEERQRKIMAKKEAKKQLNKKLVKELVDMNVLHPTKEEK